MNNQEFKTWEPTTEQESQLSPPEVQSSTVIGLKSQLATSQPATCNLPSFSSSENENDETSSEDQPEFVSRKLMSSSGLDTAENMSKGAIQVFLILYNLYLLFLRIRRRKRQPISVFTLKDSILIRQLTVWNMMRNWHDNQSSSCGIIIVNCEKKYLNKCRFEIPVKIPSSKFTRPIRALEKRNSELKASAELCNSQPSSPAFENETHKSRIKLDNFKPGDCFETDLQDASKECTPLESLCQAQPPGVESKSENNAYDPISGEDSIPPGALESELNDASKELLDFSLPLESELDDALQEFLDWSLLPEMVERESTDALQEFLNFSPPPEALERELNDALQEFLDLSLLPETVERESTDALQEFMRTYR